MCGPMSALASEHCRIVLFDFSLTKSVQPDRFSTLDPVLNTWACLLVLFIKM